MKKLYTILRWELKFVRFLSKQIRALFVRNERVCLSTCTEFSEKFNAESWSLIKSNIELPKIDIMGLEGIAEGKAFVDVGKKFLEERSKIFCDVMKNPEIEKLVIDYFDGSPWLWNMAINYSDISKGTSSSQLWHFDYGDTKQLHVMVYLSDVCEEAGPFTFMKRETSDKVKRNIFRIERFTDEQLEHKFGINAKSKMKKAIGKRGDIWIVDPGKLLHQGARCSVPRLVAFITFTSRSPMSSGGKSTIDKKDRMKLYEDYISHSKGILNQNVFY